jgi:hypothetical protein
MLAEAHPVRDLDVGPGLAAYAAVEQLTDPTGATRDRVDKRRRLRYDHVWVRTPTPPPATADHAGLTERDLRWLIATDNPRRGRRAQALAHPAAA